MNEHLATSRAQKHTRRHLWSVVLAALFYIGLIPTVLVFSGPIYSALECTLGDCRPNGITVHFVLSKRSRLRIGSPIRLPSGDHIGEVVGFERGSVEDYTVAVGTVLDPHDALVLFASPVRCAVEPNLSLETDADLVLSNCPGTPIDGINQRASDPLTLICGSIDHFERVGQELRRFILDNMRPGTVTQANQLSGPCGTDNEIATRQMVNRLEALSERQE